MKMEKMAQMKLSTSQLTARIIILSAMALLVADTVYMNLNGLYGADHTKCIVFSSMPKWCFYLLENVGELFVVVILGVMIGVIAEQYFRKIKRFYPKNQLLAFAYGSILPVCSCGVVPLIDSMKRRTSLKVIITFVCAAPLLDPYIIFLSYTVLGFKYMVIRIVCSFLLSFSAGWIVELVVKKLKWENWTDNGACAHQCDFVADRDLFVKTMKITKKLLPYILLAGLLSFCFAMLDTKELLHDFNLNTEPLSAIIMTAFGVPIYMCHGADVIFLKPFLQYTDMSIGSAMAFSLSSSAICISSIVMLSKYLGKRVAGLLTGVISVLIVLLSVLVNWMF
jgi:uncharacterized membrane protein YraQ (UPF0718 family)